MIDNFCAWLVHVVGMSITSSDAGSSRVRALERGANRKLLGESIAAIMVSAITRFKMYVLNIGSSLDQRLFTASAYSRRNPQAEYVVMRIDTCAANGSDMAVVNAESGTRVPNFYRSDAQFRAIRQFR